MSGSFDLAFDENRSEGSGIVFGVETWAPACSLLNLIPGIEEEGGLCGANSTLGGQEDLDVCTAIAEDGAAADRLGPDSDSLMGVIAEPGTCADLQGAGGSCWTTPVNHAWYAAWSKRRAVLPGTSTCFGGVGSSNVSLAVAMHCPTDYQHDGVRVVMEWVDATPPPDTCAMEGDLDEVLGEESWNGGNGHTAPRWRCFDVPLGELGEETYRAMLYSVGRPPCLYPEVTTTDKGAALVSGARTSRHGVAEAMSGVAALLVAWATSAS